VDAAEDHEEEALLLNAKAPEMLSRTCRKAQVKLAHISTDYVFDGTKDTPYTEDDPPCPVNVYGASKLAGENAIRHQMSDYLIIRTQWLIGLHGRNFVSTILTAAQVREPLSVVNDQWGAPTFAPDLARAVAALVSCTARGVFHVATGARRPGTTCLQAVELVGTPQDRARSTAEYPRPAKRPPYSVLTTKNSRKRQASSCPFADVPWRTISWTISSMQRVRP
jgi:dTDP-4-dehydrorhamnose reductase